MEYYWILAISPSSGFHQYNTTANGPDRTGFLGTKASGSVIDVQGC